MTEPTDSIPARDDDWERPIPHWSADPFTVRRTIHGLASEEVRSALHKHIRHGRREQAVLAALELARTDPAHETMLWSRLQIIAAEDIGMAEPTACTVVRSLREGVLEADPGAYDRLVFAAHAAGYLALCPKDTTNVEILQLALLDETVVTIPPEAICVHTRQGQELGRTMSDWFEDAMHLQPEVPDRDHTWRDAVRDRYRELDPPSETR